MTIQKSRFSSEAAPQPAGSQAVNLAVQASDMSVIKFEGVKVRIVNVHGVPWFIAKDVCDALELTNPSQALKALDDDEKGVTLSYTLGGTQKMRTIAESGFYKLLARSRKATTPGTLAHRFCNWVFRELHSFLKVGRDFSNWIKDRIAEYGFVEGVDYVVFTKFGENPQGGRPQKEYAIRQHMSAYQLALVAYLERSNATLLDVGMPFDERKEQLAAMLAIKVEREGKQ